MARRWQAVQVALLGGGGIVCDPLPGRVLVCPTGTTFDQLGLAVDLAFARWDLSHLRMFEMSDGTMVMDEELAADTVSAPFSLARRSSSSRRSAAWSWNQGYSRPALRC